MDEKDIELDGSEWHVNICQQGHRLCYVIMHKGDIIHFQPIQMEIQNYRLMQALDDQG